MRTFPENMDPDLLTAFLSNETSPEESILVKEWIASSEENKTRFEAFEKIWNASETAFPLPAEVDTEKAWQKLAGKIEKYESEKPEIRDSKEIRRLFIRYALRAAAVFIPALIAGYLIISHYSGPKTLTFVSTQEVLEKTLSDGSIIKLNQNSKLQYPESFDEAIREVSLTGEAFFSVSPNPEKPFIIHSGVVDVKVVGTSFNVNASPENNIIEVFVKEGKVVVYAVNAERVKTDSIFLEAGSKGIFDKKTALLQKAVQANGSELFWINQTLIFNKTRLETVFAVIAEKYHVEIRLKNEEIGNLRLTTSFEGQPIENIMNVIAESFKLKISQTGSTYTIDGSQN